MHNNFIDGQLSPDNLFSDMEHLLPSTLRTWTNQTKSQNYALIILLLMCCACDPTMYIWSLTKYRVFTITSCTLNGQETTSIQGRIFNFWDCEIINSTTTIILTLGCVYLFYRTIWCTWGSLEMFLLIMRSVNTRDNSILRVDFYEYYLPFINNSCPIVFTTCAHLLLILLWIA